MYHTDENVLLGAPTGSGKTISSELAMLRCFSAHPGRKIIYIAPLKVGVPRHLFEVCEGPDESILLQAADLRSKQQVAKS